MAAILVIEHAAAPSQRREMGERLAALALLESAQLIFAAADEDRAREVTALAFADRATAEAVLRRWRAAGAVPADAAARVLRAAPAAKADPPILLFP